MRWRGSVAVGKRGDLVGWWAMGVAVVVHAVLLLGLRVEHEEAGGWVARQPLIWETQRQRLGIEKGVGEGIGWMRGRFSGDVPVVGKFSRKIEEFVGRVGEVAVGGSVVLYERGRVGERGGETTKKGRGLVWHVEVGDGLPLELQRILRQHDGDVVASNYTPVRPVVMEVAVG
ncbi:MAG: hypothetical protein N2595_08235, partial [bacterium]|nr:hypothetical protein [bacterium]